MKKYNWFPDFVYGGMDGVVTTFAVVAGVVGSSLSSSVILILGFANLIADGFSMACSKFMSDRAELEQMRVAIAAEKELVLKKPEEEKALLAQIFAKNKVKVQDADALLNLITQYPKTWLEILMRHEMRVAEQSIVPWKGAFSTFGAFILIGFIPLAAYVFTPFLNLTDRGLFIFASIATLGALFIIGIVKTRFTDRFWLRAGIESALIGGVAASLAYFVGYFAQKMV